MISATVAGHLGKDAELRYTQDGGPVLNFSVASTEKKDGPTTWVRCALFGKRGEAVAQYLKKGTPVCVSGGLTMREFESQGEKRTSLDMRVDGLKLMGIAKSGDDAQRGAPTRSTRETSDDELPF